MSESGELDARVKEAVEAAIQVYTSDRDWRAWAEAWLSKGDRTSEAALLAASLIPGTEESLTVLIKGFQKIRELYVLGQETSSETVEDAMAALIGEYERRLPQSVDLEAAIPRTAAEFALWSTLSAAFAAAGASDKALSCAETALELCEMLDDED